MGRKIRLSRSLEVSSDHIYMINSLSFYQTVFILFELKMCCGEKLENYNIYVSFI